MEGVRAQGSSWALGPPVWRIPFPPPKAVFERSKWNCPLCFCCRGGWGLTSPSSYLEQRNLLSLASVTAFQAKDIAWSFSQQTHLVPTRSCWFTVCFQRKYDKFFFVMVRTQVTIKLFNLATQIIVIFHSFLLHDSCSGCGFHAARLQEARLFVIVKSSICESLNTNHCSVIDNSLCLYLISIFHI